MAQARSLQAQLTKLSVALLVGLVAFVQAGAAFAQDKGPATERMEASIRVSKQGLAAGTTENLSALLNTLPDVPGVDPLANQKGETGGQNGKEADLGKNIHLNNNIILPPLKGFRQLADADPIKDMYKELITKKVPVLFQTMMMVENGAATGYIGSLGAVSNLMNNTVQTQQFQLQLMDLTDTTGQMKYAYVGAMQKAIQDGKAKSWPAAIYMANGDAAKSQGGQNSEFGDLEKSSKPFSLLTLPSNQQQQQNNGDEKLTEKLSEILFAKEGNSNASQGDDKHDNQKLDQLKKEYIDLVGDLEIEIDKGKSSDQIGRIIKVKYIKPNPVEDKRWGVQKKVYKESDIVWKNMNKMLAKMCQFKKGENQGGGGAEDDNNIPATMDNFWTDEMLKGASSPDITMTSFLIDEIWAAFRPPSDLEDIQCQQEFPENSKFPDAANFQKASKDDPYDCKSGGNGGEVKPCVRNRIMVHIASLIGRSRAYHAYNNLAMYSSRYAKDPATMDLNDKLFAEVIGGHQFISTYIDQNRDAWIQFDNKLNKYLAGRGSSGAALVTQQHNNLPNYRQGGYADRQ